METPSNTLPGRRNTARNASLALATTPPGVASHGHGSGKREGAQQGSGVCVQLDNLWRGITRTHNVRWQARSGVRRHATLRQASLMGSEGGMATAEYAIATLAAVGLAGLLVVILRSEEVRGFLLNLVRTALSLP